MNPSVVRLLSRLDAAQVGARVVGYRIAEGDTTAALRELENLRVWIAETSAIASEVSA